ncbi:MAG: hypothetical protein ABL907_21500 [Hyphomicrobium sp.]
MVAILREVGWDSITADAKTHGLNVQLIDTSPWKRASGTTRKRFATFQADNVMKVHRAPPSAILIIALMKESDAKKEWRAGAARTLSDRVPLKAQEPERMGRNVGDRGTLLPGFRASGAAMQHSSTMRAVAIPSGSQVS